MVRLYGNLIRQVLKNVVKLGILLFVNCCIYHLKPILGSLIGQRHISTQLQLRNFCFLSDAFNSNNHIENLICDQLCIIRILVLDINKHFIITNLIWICIIIAPLEAN